jgi:AraC-like DNA-binding protein
VAYARNEIFERLCAELNAHPTSTLAKLAARLQVHRHTITEIVRERTGVHFRAWRDRRLFDRTYRLLQQRGVRSIKEISSLAGFNSTRAFDRFIKRHTGCRPTELKFDRLSPSRFGPKVYLFAKRSAEDR